MHESMNDIDIRQISGLGEVSGVTIDFSTDVIEVSASLRVFLWLNMVFEIIAWRDYQLWIFPKISKTILSILKGSANAKG